EGQPLQKPHGDEQDGGQYAGHRIGGQKPDAEGGKAHDADGDEEGPLAALAVAQLAEEQGAQGADGKARREGEQREDEGGGVVDARKEMLRDDGGQRAEEDEIIPLEQRPGPGGEYDAAQLPAFAVGGLVHWH